MLDFVGFFKISFSFLMKREIMRFRGVEEKGIVKGEKESEKGEKE